MVTVSHRFGNLLALVDTDQITEINLNAGIVSNKGFIRQMASPGTSIIAGKYISAWGGIQSAGQTVGQVVCLYLHSWSGKVTNHSPAPTICHGKVRSEGRVLYNLARHYCEHFY